jgi:hypothetical protein
LFHLLKRNEYPSNFQMNKKVIKTEYSRRRKALFGDCIAATIAAESPHHALRMGGLAAESVCAALL